LKNTKKIIKGGERYAEQRRKKDFALSASYGLRQMVLNGKILFGDQLTNYVNDIANNILVNFNFDRKNEIDFLSLSHRTLMLSLQIKERYLFLPH